MSLIVLEGPNGAGKSTLATQLSMLLDYPIVHAIRPNTEREALDASLDQLYLQDVILDRSHAISRLMYQADSISGPERDILSVHAIHLAARAKIIYCVGEGEHDTDKPHYTPELIEETKDQTEIRQKYELIFDALPHQKYDFKKDEISCLQLD